MAAKLQELLGVLLLDPSLGFKLDLGPHSARHCTPSAFMDTIDYSGPYNSCPSESATDLPLFIFFLIFWKFWLFDLILKGPFWQWSWRAGTPSPVVGFLVTYKIVILSWYINFSYHLCYVMFQTISPAVFSSQSHPSACFITSSCLIFVIFSVNHFLLAFEAMKYHICSYFFSF